MMKKFNLKINVMLLLMLATACSHDKLDIESYQQIVVKQTISPFKLAKIREKLRKKPLRSNKNFILLSNTNVQKFNILRSCPYKSLYPYKNKKLCNSLCKQKGLISNKTNCYFSNNLFAKSDSSIVSNSVLYNFYIPIENIEYQANFRHDEVAKLLSTFIMQLR